MTKTSRLPRKFLISYDGKLKIKIEGYDKKQVATILSEVMKQLDKRYESSN